MTGKETLSVLFGELTGREDCGRASLNAKSGKTTMPLKSELTKGFLTLEAHGEERRNFRVFYFGRGSGERQILYVENDESELVWDCGNSAAPVSYRNREFFTAATKTLNLREPWPTLLIDTYDRMLGLLSS